MSEILGSDGRPTSDTPDFQLEASVSGPLANEDEMRTQTRRMLAAFLADFGGWNRPLTFWFESMPTGVTPAGTAVVGVRLRVVGQGAGRELGRAAVEAGIAKERGK